MPLLCESHYYYNAGSWSPHLAEEWPSNDRDGRASVIDGDAP
jgi:hypothetical protein